MSDTKVSHWSNKIYPCSEGCGFIGSLDSFSYGQCYSPCPRCGAKRDDKKTGRFHYKKKRVFKWLPFLYKWEFDKVEWRETK